ncbi:MAG: helix-turn-helix domain-containing protein, partial [Duncaniella sp.]|nr:helix-turn-helix domain-containing protein [Duncaniella sp.]
QLNSGYDLPAIAEAKGIKAATVYSHIATLISQDRLTDFSSVITREQYLRVMEVAGEHPDTLYDILTPEMPDGLVRVALAMSDYMLRQKANMK